MELIIYHEIKPGVPCPDGITAAWIASARYPTAKVMGCQYGNVPDLVGGNYRSVLIVDFSFPRAVLNQWLESGIDVTVIDHHETAMNDLRCFGLEELIKGNAKGNGKAYFDMYECGATLTWKTLFPNAEPPAFLTYVRSRDLWLDCNLFADQIPNTLVVHEAMSGQRYGKSIGEIFGCLNKLSNLSEEQLLDWAWSEAGAKVKAKQRKVAELALNHSWGRFDIDGGRHAASVPVVTLNGPTARYISDVGMALYRAYPEAPFVAIVTDGHKVSLRSDKDGADFSVNIIAEHFGGGGHRNAAGFTCETVPIIPVDTPEGSAQGMAWLQGFIQG